MKTVSLTVLGSGLTAPFSGFTNYSNKKVSIVGAGLAGLTCAYQLKKAGITANVYEASHRIGGRVLTLNNCFSSSISVELGGEFIDSNHYDILSLIREFDLELLDTFQDSYSNPFFLVNDVVYKEEEVIREFNTITHIIQKTKNSYDNAYRSEDIMPIDKMSVESYIDSLPCLSWLKRILVNAYEAEFGLDASEQSAMNFVDMIDVDTSKGFHIFGDSDERFKIKGGNQILIDKLHQSLHSHIHKNKNLRRVGGNHTKYTMYFSDDTAIETDFLILAIPFSVLRHVSFDNGLLDKEKLDCIRNLGYGTNNKIIFPFSSRPWRRIKNSNGAVFGDTIQNGWDSNHMINNNRGATGYTIYLGGSKSVDLRKKSNSQLISIYGSKLNEIFESKELFEDVKTAFWSHYPLSLGSYSCYKPGQWSTIAGRESEPCGNIYFTGEHCSENFQGFMNGAVESGKHVAQHILSNILG